MRFSFRLDLSLHAGTGKKFRILNFAIKQEASQPALCCKVSSTEPARGTRPGFAQPVGTGPVWPVGPVPVWAGTKPAQIQNLNLNSKKWKISKKNLKNILRCDEFNDVNFSQKFIHLV